jgi:hypothetical protein
MDCLARTRGASWHDVLKLASKAYHVRYDGVKQLLECIITKCGLTHATGHMEDANFCYQDVFRVHCITYDGWYDSRQNRSGPNVPYIVEKAFSLFPCLKSATMEETVRFYDDLQSTGLYYLLPLMPFDAIYIPFGFEDLCPPGLGTGRYTEVSTALMDLLPGRLPVNSTQRVSATVAAVTMESNNGYDLLFRIMVLSVPGFNPTLPLLAPLWTSSTDLFEFCHSHHFYFRIQEKNGLFFDDRTKVGFSSMPFGCLSTLMWL